ncbi:MAG: phosphate ABC transporter substrate-binding/OmpA family protein [Pseudomonadota bacterium]
MSIEPAMPLSGGGRYGHHAGTYVRRLTAALALLFLSSATSSAQSDSEAVELHAFDGSAVVKGELVEVSDGSYVLRTALGTLRIGLEEAECKGTACPLLDRFDSDFAIRVDDASLASLMMALLSGYAEDLDADHRITEGTNGVREVLILDRESGKRLTGVDLLLSSKPGEASDTAPGELRVFFDQQSPPGEDRSDELLLALDGVAVIAHQENSIGILDEKTIAGVFACAETDLSGLNGSVRLYVPGVSSKAYQTFKANVLDPADLALCSQATQLDVDADVAGVVANDPSALGFVSLDEIGYAKALPMTACHMTRQPTAFSVKAGDYPLTRHVLLNAPPLGESSAAAQRFIDYALGSTGQQRVDEAGFVGLNVGATKSDDTNYLMTRLEAATKLVQNTQLIYQLIEEADDAVRLSTTFHFRSGTAAIDEAYSLDNRAQRDLTRLVRYLETDVDSGFELLVFGFADASGDYEANLALSQQRAQSVADKLAAFGVPITSVIGFGEEAPIACNDDPAGRAHNRRVEVWLRMPKHEASDQSAWRVPM